MDTIYNPSCHEVKVFKVGIFPEKNRIYPESNMPPHIIVLANTQTEAEMKAIKAGYLVRR